METKICKKCGRELSLADYRMTRWGSYADTCNECIENKRAETRYSHAQTGGG